MNAVMAPHAAADSNITFSPPTLNENNTNGPLGQFTQTTSERLDLGGSGDLYLDEE